MKAGEYGTAPKHGPKVISARNEFIAEIRARFPRASELEAEAFIDYMIGAEYLSERFFNAWDLNGGDDE